MTTKNTRKKSPAAEAPKTTVFLRGEYIINAQAVAAETHKGNFSAYIQSLVEKDLFERAANAPMVALASKFAPWAKETTETLFEGVNQARFIAMLMEELDGYIRSLADDFATESEALELQKNDENVDALRVKIANRAIRSKGERAEPIVISFNEANRLQAQADDMLDLLTAIFVKGKKIEDMVKVEITTHPKYGQFVTGHVLLRAPVAPAPAAMLAMSREMERKYHEEREAKLSGK